MAIHPGEGVAKEEKFLHNRKLSQACVWGVGVGGGELCNLRGQYNWEGKKEKKNAPNRD